MGLERHALCNRGASVLLQLAGFPLLRTDWAIAEKLSDNRYKKRINSESVRGIGIAEITTRGVTAQCNYENQKFNQILQLPGW
jgi:hypothetical protein